MSVTLEQVRAAIGAHMAMVPDMGVIHPYERYSKTEEAFRALYAWRAPDASVDELRGWFIHRRAGRDYEKTSSIFRIETDWMIKGYMGLQDSRATGLIMDGLVENLQRVFRQHPTLGDVVERPRTSVETPIGLSVAESGPYMFAGYLCHGVTLTLTTTHYADAFEPVDALGDLETIHANWELPPRALTGPALPDDDDAAASDNLSHLNEA